MMKNGDRNCQQAYKRLNVKCVAYPSAHSRRIRPYLTVLPSFVQVLSMIFTRILFAAVAIPFVLARNGGGNGLEGGGECPSNHFKWEAKDCCLPYGGPPQPVNPPEDSQCPSNWSWHWEKGCCTPHQPPQQLPPPQCDHGWNWFEATYSCCPGGGGSPTIPHLPSGIPIYLGGGNYGGHGAYPKRKLRSRTISICPQGLAACAVTSLTGGDYECVDTVSDLDNCGGCALFGEGQNCNAIPGVWNVGCEQSSCKIYTCAQGYRLAHDGKSCVAA